MPLKQWNDRLGGALLFGLAVMFIVPAEGQASAVPLELEVKIPLGLVIGRLGQLSTELKRHRLLLAETENDSLGVVDLAARRPQRTMIGPKKPGLRHLHPARRIAPLNA